MVIAIVRPLYAIVGTYIVDMISRVVSIDVADVKTH